MGERCDAVIIGAGVIGCAVALELARKGWRTLSLDALPAAGYGSTSASAGVVRVYYSTLLGTAMAYEGYHYWKDWRGHLGLPETVELARFVEVDRRSRWNVEDEVLAGLAVAARAGAAATGGRSEMVSMAEVTQRRLTGVDAEIDRSPAAAVAAVRATARHVGLLPEGRGPVPAIAGTHRLVELASGAVITPANARAMRCS